MLPPLVDEPDRDIRVEGADFGRPQTRTFTWPRAKDLAIPRQKLSVMLRSIEAIKSERRVAEHEAGHALEAWSLHCSTELLHRLNY